MKKTDQLKIGQTIYVVNREHIRTAKVYSILKELGKEDYVILKLSDRECGISLPSSWDFTKEGLLKLLSETAF